MLYIADINSTLLVETIQSEIDIYSTMDGTLEYDDVFLRDKILFPCIRFKNSYEFPIKVRTKYIMLMYDGLYYGHIYCWRSVGNPKVLFAMGIRKAILNNKSMGVNGDKYRRNIRVAVELINGLKSYASQLYCDSIFIVKPLPNMAAILRGEGFIEKEIPSIWIGKSVACVDPDMEIVCDGMMYYL